MDIEIKKDLVSNWFKLLQNAICDDISRLEKNKIKFKSTSWQRSKIKDEGGGEYRICLLYTSPSPRDRQKSRMPSSAWKKTKPNKSQIKMNPTLKQSKQMTEDNWT